MDEKATVSTSQEEAKDPEDGVESSKMTEAPETTREQHNAQMGERKRHMKSRDERRRSSMQAAKHNGNISRYIYDVINSTKSYVEHPYGDISSSSEEDNTSKGGGDDHMEQALTEDIYSLMSTVPACSFSFVFALIVFLMQFMIIILVLIDLVDFSDNPIKTNGVVNRMGIPADAPMTVTAAQGIGVVLTVNFVCGQGDLLVGFTHLLNGYSAEILKSSPHATAFKWYLAGTCQFLVGIFLTIDLFILMMQSTSNIMLCLNFAALHFVQDIDNVAFCMAEMGLLTRRVQKDCNSCGDVKVPRKQSRALNFIRRAFVIALTSGLYAGFFLIAFGWQWSGRFMCKSVHVQFGDVWGPEWPYYSGIFNAKSLNYKERIEGKPVYIDQSGTIRLAYCSGEQAWTFSNMTETDDHCDYFIKSSQTKSFDIMDIATNMWFAWWPDLGDVPMDWLDLSCNDCNDELCAADVGFCSDNKCVCNEDRIGLHCEFQDTEEHLCSAMALDRRSKADISSMAFASLFTRREYRRFETQHIETMYGRPIYVSMNPFTGKVDVFIIFTGYRWIIFGVPQEETSNLTITDVETYLLANDPTMDPLHTLETISHDALKNFVPFFFSSPVEFETKSHSVDPIDVSWVLTSVDETLPVVGAKADINHPVSASFLCSHCNNNTNPCLNGGICRQNNTCDCTDPETGIQSYGGGLCEYAFSCSEFNAREGLEEGLNGCKCDPVFGICTECESRLYYGNLCQYKRKEPITVDVEFTSTGRLVCEDSKCQNGGYCTNNLEGCTCSYFYEGFFCENRKSSETNPPGQLCNGTSCVSNNDTAINIEEQQQQGSGVGPGEGPGVGPGNMSNQTTTEPPETVDDGSTPSGTVLVIIEEEEGAEVATTTDETSCSPMDCYWHLCEC